MELRKYLFFIALPIMALLIVLIWFYPSGKDFRTENPFWNGAKAFSDSFSTSQMKSYADLTEYPDKTTLVMIPYTEITNEELELLYTYINAGGALVLADDYGYGNTVLNYLQINASFIGAPLLDPLFNYKNSFYPRITDFTNSALATNVESIVLNHATGLTVGAGVNIVAESAVTSFIDLNDNELSDQWEPIGPLPVAACANVGNGIVIILSDPSIIINCMRDVEDNYAFISNIVQVKGPDSEIVFDEVHLPEGNLEGAKGSLANIRDALATPAGTISLVTAIVVLILLPIWLRRKGGNHGS